VLGFIFSKDKLMIFSLKEVDTWNMYNVEDHRET